jgi:Family of unknown function (DUF5329)
LRIVLIAIVVSLAVVTARPVRAGEVAAEGVEHQTIEALIESVAQLTDATFLRNGKSYPASSAGSAEEFIDRVASFSSTTGTPYVIRFAEGREVSSAEYLRSELAKLRAKHPD